MIVAMAGGMVFLLLMLYCFDWVCNRLFRPIFCKIQYGYTTLNVS